MITRVIEWSTHNRSIVLLLSAALAFAGLWASRTMTIDALPDLSDLQVIVRTSFPGQAPRVVEDQVTYPLASALLSAPGVRTVRGYSLFGESLVYVLLEDGTDLATARQRVQEYVNQVLPRLPPRAHPALGPDATGVGWILEYVLTDRTQRRDLSELRALQDWQLKDAVRAVRGVAEVATIGGMVRQYQVVLDPGQMQLSGVSYGEVASAIAASNAEVGGGAVEHAEAEYMLRASSYLKSVADIEQIPVKVAANGHPTLLSQIARVQLGPEMRRGIAELDGTGEVVGAVVIMRSGSNALDSIAAVKARLAALAKSLPEGVGIEIVYDRSDLIGRAISNLTLKIIEELVIVALVCLAFLAHARSAVAIIVILPLGMLAAFVVMRCQGLSANIMSLAGVAIAFGAMVDAAVVMIENAHRHLEAAQAGKDLEEPDAVRRSRVLVRALQEVGPSLFVSLVIITLSFLPVLALEAQEGRMFSPLVYTKTYAMAAAAILSISLVPALIGYLMPGRATSEMANPINRTLIAWYRPVLDWALRRPWPTLALSVLALLAALYPAFRLGSEFMPPLDEGDVLYMPTALPGISPETARHVLQQTDRLIMTVPEVASAFGKAGRAETATDPAPLEMIETTIRLKPRAAWRAGMSKEQLISELDDRVRLPGLQNVWTQPIRGRIDMLATGIKSPVGIKITGPDLGEIERIGLEVEHVAQRVPGVFSAVAERTASGRYIDVDIDRLAAARYGLTVSSVQDVVVGLIGGQNVGETVEGRRRFPISVRYPRELRDSIQALRELPMIAPAGARLTLADVARVTASAGPSMIRSEDASPAAWVYVDVRGRAIASVVMDIRRAVESTVKLPAGYLLAWSGQYEQWMRARERLILLVPAVLVVITGLLFLTFRRLDETLVILCSLPFSLVGGLWFTYLLGFNFSVAVAVGLLALAGVAAEFGVIMLLYLKQAWQRRLASGEAPSAGMLVDAIREGALLRVRPKAMTVAVILAGLAPVMWGHGAGTDVMQRIAAPLVGGMITAPLLSMLIVPAAFLILRSRELE